MEEQPGNREESCMTCKPYDIPKTLIWEAWLHVKANQGAAGIDAETIERFEKKLGDNLPGCRPPSPNAVTSSSVSRTIMRTLLFWPSAMKMKRCSGSLENARSQASYADDLLPQLVTAHPQRGEIRYHGQSRPPSRQRLPSGST